MTARPDVRRVRRSGLVACLALALLPVAPAAGAGPALVHPARTPAPTDPRVVAVSVSPSVVSASGTTPATVVVTVQLAGAGALKDTCGIYDGGQTGSAGAFVDLRRVDAADPRVAGFAPDVSRQRLRLTSGTGDTGTWTARVAVPSTWAGTWQVDYLVACGDSPTPPLQVSPATIGHPAPFTVVGEHLPALSMGTSPNPVAWNATGYLAKGRLRDTATGEGLAGRRLEWCNDTGCGIDGGYTGHPVVTDARGYYSFTVDPRQLPPRLNLWTGRVPAVGFGTQEVSLVLTRTPKPVTRPAVAAKPNATTVAAGAGVTVAGRFFDAGRCEGLTYDERVDVQYLYGRTAWRTAATASVRSSGRFDVVVPARAGRWAYRVAFAGTPGIDGWGVCVPAVSTRFVVTGT